MFWDGTRWVDVRADPPGWRRRRSGILVPYSMSAGMRVASRPPARQRRRSATEFGRLMRSVLGVLMVIEVLSQITGVRLTDTILLGNPASPMPVPTATATSAPIATTTPPLVPKRRGGPHRGRTPRGDVDPIFGNRAR
jgi:hypothetical protein